MWQCGHDCLSCRDRSRSVYFECRDGFYSAGANSERSSADIATAYDFPNATGTRTGTDAKGSNSIPFLVLHITFILNRMRCLRACSSMVRAGDS